jgi:hypothetical protein
MRNSRGKGEEPQYIIRTMRARSLTLTVLLAGLLAAGACSSPFGRHYEYEEQLYLGVDGAATVVVDASVPALVALRGLPLDPAPRARVDPEQVRALFVRAGCGDVRVGQPWVRNGRHFVQVRIVTANVETLQTCQPLGWSTYRFERADGQIHFEQTVGAAAARRVDGTKWTGEELVAFKLHLPSRVLFHNVRRLEDGAPGQPTRGNILTWEQRLADRLASRPVQIEVRMDAESILYRTLWLFAGAFAAAVLALTLIIWITVRRARRRGFRQSRTAEPSRSA